MIKPIACLAALAFAGACAAQPPHKLSLSYDLSYNGVVAAELTEVLEHDGKRFSLTSEGRGKGIGALLYRGAAKRWCRGEVTGAGLRPLEYRDQRGDKPAAVARFDWVRKTLTQEHRIYPQAVRWILEDQLVIESGVVRVKGDHSQQLYAP